MPHKPTGQGRMALAPRAGSLWAHGKLISTLRFVAFTCFLLAYAEACLLYFLHGCMWCHGAKVSPCMSKTGSVQEGFQSTKLYPSHRPLKPNHIPGKEWRDLVFNIFGIRWKPIPEKHPWWVVIPSRGNKLSSSLFHVPFWRSQLEACCLACSELGEAYQSVKINLFPR